MITIQNLKKSFRTEEVETLALNNVNLKVERTIWMWKIYLIKYYRDVR